MIAELALSAIGQLEDELAVIMAPPGASISAGEASLLIEEAFDIINVIGRQRDGGTGVEKNNGMRRFRARQLVA